MIGMRRLADVDQATDELDELVAEVAASLGENESPRDRTDANPFFVRAVLPLIGPLLRGDPTRPLRVGDRIIGRGRRARDQLRHQLWGTAAGVFLAGATPDQARRWAMRQARRVGGTVVPVERHRGGRPHFHIRRPDGRRSGHIFWGTPPTGTFFDPDR
jgi:hypothetical protein